MPNNKTDMTRYKKTYLIILFLLAISFMWFAQADAEMKTMSDKELDGISARQSLSEFTIEDNSVRVFCDIHIETYLEVDSIKMGYYEKSDNGIGQTGGLATSKFGGVPDDNYSSLGTYQGLQGTGQNQNYNDWDINWENLQLGNSETEPLIINGVITIVEFDDISSPNRKVERLVMGTNDMQGTISADMLRTTGMVNPMLSTDSTLRAQGDTNPESGNPILLKRDSFLTNWDDKLVFNASDNDTGFWWIFTVGTGPNGETDHIGWEIVAGYDERAIDFSYSNGIDDIDISGY